MGKWAVLYITSCPAGVLPAVLSIFLGARTFLVNNTTKNVLHYDKKRRQKKNSSYGYYYYIDFALVDVTSSLLPPPPLYRAMKETMTYIKGKKRGNRRAIRE
jgi:hypothetical protein